MKPIVPLAPEQSSPDRRSRRGPRVGQRAALPIVLVYVVVGAAWIMFSDQVLAALVADPTARDRLQTAKGAVYVVATAALLYVLIARARAHQAARDLERRAVSDSIVDALLVTDDAGRLVDVNAAALRLIGLEEREAIGVPLADVLARARFRHLDGRPLTFEESATARALRGETVDGFECTLHRPDGRVVFASVSASPVNAEPGMPPSRAVAVIRDVTEFRRFEQEREEFLATAAHELKTPLAVVKAYAQLMRKRDQGDPEALSAIERQIDRLARIVQQLLEVSRFRSSAGGELRKERVDLSDLVDEVAGRARTAAATIRVQHPGPVFVLGDRDRLAQVLLNLLENAIRFSPTGGEVAVRVERNGAQAVVSVRDHGVGIPAERQARIFERFYRAHAGTPQDYGGLGLGLDVSREIVARHGGRIWFESRTGHGSTFSFSLPLLAEEAHA